MFYDEHNPESPQEKPLWSQFLPKATAHQSDNSGRKSGSEHDRQGCRGRFNLREDAFGGTDVCWIGETMFTWEISGVFCSMAAKRSPEGERCGVSPPSSPPFKRISINTDVLEG